MFQMRLQPLQCPNLGSQVTSPVQTCYSGPGQSAYSGTLYEAAECLSGTRGPAVGVPETPMRGLGQVDRQCGRGGCQDRVHVVPTLPVAWPEREQLAGNNQDRGVNADSANGTISFCRPELVFGPVAQLVVQERFVNAWTADATSPRWPFGTAKARCDHVQNPPNRYPSLCS